MSRRDWLACQDPAVMLRLLRARRLLTERKARLFGAACCRRHWALLGQQARRAVEAVERHADGLAGREELDAARVAFTAGLGEATGSASFATAAVAYLLADAGTDPPGYALDLSPWAAQAGTSSEGGLAAQADIVRCLFGPPFRRVVADSRWLAWSGGTVARLAEAVYAEGAFDRLPVLADALEDAGCSDAGLLGHLRGAGPHFLGCFVLDSLLAKG